MVAVPHATPIYGEFLGQKKYLQVAILSTLYIYNDERWLNSSDIGSDTCIYKCLSYV